MIMPKVSLIVPIYNVEEYVADCINSIVCQSYQNMEIICVNDCTPDNSMTIVKDIALNDKRIKIINNDSNRGLGGARNAGLDVATGQFVMFIDSDDMLMPNAVELLVSEIVTTESDMVFCDVLVGDSIDSSSVQKPFHGIHNKKSLYICPTDYVKFTSIWPSAWNKIYRKDLIDKAKLRYIENILYEDHTFYYEYVSLCRKIKYLEKPLYFYLCSRKGQITKIVNARVYEIFEIINKIKKILEKQIQGDELNATMAKISLRLLFERLWPMDPKSFMYKQFLKESRKFLSVYSKELLLKNRDYFIPQDSPLVCSDIELFLRRLSFSKKKNLLYTEYQFLGIRFCRIHSSGLKLLLNKIENS